MDTLAIPTDIAEMLQVEITVSQEYLQYAKDNDLHFLDFGWLKNAAIDYMAQQLIDAGYTNGFLISVDAARYRKFPDGKLVSTMIDPADGISKAAVDSLVAYGKQEGCLELSLKLMPLFVTENLSEDGINALTNEGVYSLWIAEKEIRYNQPDLSVKSQDEGYTATAVK